ncbi:uncharacterized protein [Temnothorax nylanderi]|uniref:uncharacterized protein n=1 Tax=Temnothorax nylanderi TaxID=102681 RepID=UPI003A8795D5
MSEDGKNCLYPTYLAPNKQGIAAKKCMEPIAKFNTYPATIRAWFVTYEEARGKLERAVDKTDLESDAEKDKANRGLRKRKHLSSEDEGDKNPTKVGKSQLVSQKGNSLDLPTFTFSPLPGERENFRKTNEGSVPCLATTISHSSDKNYNLPSTSTESQSINAQTKDNGLDFDCTRSDITKSQKSFTVSSTPPSSGTSKTMTALSPLSSRLSLNVTQPGSNNSKKKSNQGNRQSPNVFQPSSSSNNKESVSQPSSNSSKKELNRSSRSSLNVSKSSISTKEKQSNQGKVRSDTGVVGKLQKSAKKHSDISTHKNRKENKERIKKATADKSQRPVLGIADTNEKLERSNSFTSSLLLERGKSPSNSISSALPTNKNDGNNTHTDNFEEMDPRATSSPRGHDLASDSSYEDYAKDSDYEPHSNDDSISHKSLDFVDEVSQSPAIEPINLSGQETINETTDKTTVSKPAEQIDKLTPIQIMKLQYEKISRLEKAYTKLQTTVEEIRQLLLNRTEVLHHPKGLPSLPFPTLEIAKTAEDLTNKNCSIKDYILYNRDLFRF